MTDWKTILFAGPSFQSYKGGMEAVLEAYSQYVKPFKFIGTYDESRKQKRVRIFFMSFLNYVRTLIYDRDIKLVHIHATQDGSFIRKSFLVIFGALFRKKIILHIHSGCFDTYYNQSALHRKFVSFIVGLSDRVICLSQYWYKTLSGFLPEEKLVVLNNMVPRLVPLQEVQHEVREKIRLLFVSNLSKRKGIFELIDVLIKHRDQFADRVHLSIGGKGEDERLKKLIIDHDLADMVRFHGVVSGDLKAGLFRDCDIFILPSYFEGLPISIVEALSAGKPVIATRVGGIPEIVIPDYNGWLIEPGGFEALAALLLSIVENPGMLGEYGRNSLKLYEDYAPEKVMPALEKIYADVLSIP